VPYRISQQGGSIFVPKDKVHRLRMQLAAKGTPNSQGVGFEIFDKPNFGISDFVQRANYVRAIQGELARTISQLDEVEAARVMIVIPERRLLVDKPVEPTASVLVRLPGRLDLPSSSVKSIQFLVANSVEGMQANNVSVVDNHGNVLSDHRSSDSLAGLSHDQLSVRRSLEDYHSKKAETMLERVLGPGQAVVRVAADINWDSLTTTEERYDPESQVERDETVTDETTQSGNPTQGDAVGISGNVATETNQVASAATTSSLTKRKTSTLTYEINKTTSNLIQAAGGVKHLSAAVFVAARFEGTGEERTMVPRTQEELNKLRDIVRNTLGMKADGADPGNLNQITLEEIAFNNPPAFEMNQEFQTDEKRQYWWQLVKNMLYPFLALLILFAFWRALKSTAKQEIPIGIPLGEEAAMGHAGSYGEGNGHAASRGTKQHASGNVTVEVLNQLIRENPENVTQAVRSWMSTDRVEER